MIRKLLLLSVLLLATAWRPAIAGPIVEMSVVDRDSGQVLSEYDARGETWVAGVPGHRYAVRLANRSGERVLVVLSVDGVNAVSGQTADPSQAGYVLGPWETAEIAGWRKSLDDIARFVFTDLPDSYAARTGRPDNVGVIGIAVFRERRAYLRRYPRYPPPPVADATRARSASKAAAPAAESATAGSAYYGGVARQGIGTGHGEREWAPVGSTRFVRASSRPSQLTQLRYDDHDALVAIGVLPRPYPRYPQAPRAFPQGFVPDPPHW